jgi:hypothetical protein
VISIALSVVVSAAAPSSDIYAVIVGHNGGHEGEPALAPLRYADDDALRFYRWFLTLAPEDHLTLLTVLDADTQAQLADAQETTPPAVPPTRTNLLAALDALKPRLTATSKVFFIYAGHGLPGRFLLEPQSSGEAAFTGAELRSAFAALPGQRALLFLDACRAQSLFSDRGAPDFSAEVGALEHAAQTKQLGILTAASSTQSAGESATLNGGYFSHVLASGLAGAADADADGTVRFGELAAFVAFHTERLFGQRPWFEAPGGDLLAPVVELGGLPGVTFDSALTGRIRVRDAKTHRVVAELNKPFGTPRTLVLPAGAYVAEREGLQAQVQIDTARTVLGAGDFIPAPLALRGAGEPSPFDAPFSADAVSALSAGYHSGTEVAHPLPWRHAIDAQYGLAPAPFGLPGIEHSAELGYRLAFSPRWLAGLRGFFRAAAFPAGSLMRTGLWLEGAVRFQVLSALEVQPHLDVGAETLWRTGTAQFHADFGTPCLGGGLRAEVPVAAGLAVELDAKAALSFVEVDGQRQALFTPQLLVGFSWRK